MLGVKILSNFDVSVRTSVLTDDGNYPLPFFSLLILRASHAVALAKACPDFPTSDFSKISRLAYLANTLYNRTVFSVKNS